MAKQDHQRSLVTTDHRVGRHFGGDICFAKIIRGLWLSHLWISDSFCRQVDASQFSPHTPDGLVCLLSLSRGNRCF